MSIPHALMHPALQNHLQKAFLFLMAYWSYEANIPEVTLLSENICILWVLKIFLCETK